MRVIDNQTIKLATSLAGATSNLTSFSPGAVDSGTDEIKVFFDTTWCIGGSMSVSFLVNGQTYQNTEWRLEGKDYVVKDGDVIHFRFNV